jgi:aquaporin Z
MNISLTIRKFLAEFYGTFILVFIGTGSIAFNPNADLITVAFAFGFAVMLAIYTIGHISSAHLNPAVSFAMVLDRRLSWSDFGIYFLGQLLGALFASLTILMGSGLDFFQGFGPTTFDVNTPVIIVIVIEMFLTFILVYLVLAGSQRKSLQPLLGLIIGLSLVGLILVGGPLTGASLNPVRSITPALFAGGDALEQVWVYVVGPMLGAFLAVIFYRILKFTDADTTKP